MYVKVGVNLREWVYCNQVEMCGLVLFLFKAENDLL